MAVNDATDAPNALPGDFEGDYDSQLLLPLQFVEAPEPFLTVLKRDGREVTFEQSKIAAAIFSAAQSVGGQDRGLAESLAAAVAIYLRKHLHDQPPHVDQINDAVERVLVEMSHGQTALAYARYRDRRGRIRKLQSGGIRALLGDLDVPCEPPRCAESASLFVRTSAETLIQWDARRIVEALVRETGIEEEMATHVAAEVEIQIRQAKMRTLTSSLVRELVSAKLVELGLDAYRNRHRRLGLPLYDTIQIIRGQGMGDGGHGPAATDLRLARSVKKEFALSEVFSSAVGDAHLRGELYLDGLEQVDRMRGCTYALEPLLRFGIASPGQPGFSEPPLHAELLLAQMVKQSEILHGLFSGPVTWSAINIYLAPFLYGLSERHLKQFVEMLVFEFAYRSSAQAETLPPARLELCWTVPEPLRDLPAYGPGAKELAKTYGAFEHTAQQLAWAIVEVFRTAFADSIALSAPAIDFVLDARTLQSDGCSRFLQHAAAVAAARARCRFQLNRHWQADHVVAHGVTLNLPRIAFETGGEDALIAAACARVQLAALAHEEKRDFLETLKGAGAEPASPTDVDTGAYHIAVDGLHECVQHLLGAASPAPEEAKALGRRILAALSEKCHAEARRTGLRIVLTQNNAAELSQRFASLDAKEFPDQAARVVKVDPTTQTMGYTPGVRTGIALSPMDAARLEGAFHACLDAEALSEIHLPQESTTPEAIADFIRKAVHQTKCGALTFI